jgi:hypothetical protein
MLGQRPLREFVKKELMSYITHAKNQSLRKVRDHVEGAGRDPNSGHARIVVATRVLTAFDRPTLSKPAEFNALVALLIESIDGIRDSKSTLKKRLLIILERTAQHLQSDATMVDVAKSAFKHCDDYFNRGLENELLEYASARLSSRLLTKLRVVGLAIDFKELVSDENTSVKVHSAACAKYLAEKLGDCKEPEDPEKPDGPKRNKGPRDSYHLIMTMSAILNFQAERIDQPLRELIIRCQRSLVERYIAMPRVPECPENLKLLVYCYARPLSSSSNMLDPVFDVLKNSCQRQLEQLRMHVKDRDLREVLEIELHALQDWKVADMQARHDDKIRHFNNALIDKILPLLLFMKVAQSGNISMTPGRKAAIGSLLQKMINLPLLNLPGASIVGDIIGAAINEVDRRERVAANDNALKAADIQFLGQIDPFVRQIADMITLRYFQQIRMLNLDTECEHIKKIADCAVERIFQYMESDKVLPMIKSACSMKEVIDVLVMGISDYSMRHGFTIPGINVGISNLPLLMSVVAAKRPVDHDDLTVEDMLSRPGLMVVENGKARFFYHPHHDYANLDMIARYGFIISTLQEVKLLQLVELTSEVVLALPQALRQQIHLKMVHPALAKLRAVTQTNVLANESNAALLRSESPEHEVSPVLDGSSDSVLLSPPSSPALPPRRGATPDVAMKKRLAVSEPRVVLPVPQVVSVAPICVEENRDTLPVSAPPVALSAIRGTSPDQPKRLGRHLSLPAPMTPISKRAELAALLKTALDISAQPISQGPKGNAAPALEKAKKEVVVKQSSIIAAPPKIAQKLPATPVLPTTPRAPIFKLASSPSPLVVPSSAGVSVPPKPVIAVEPQSSPLISNLMNDGSKILLTASFAPGYCPKECLNDQHWEAIEKAYQRVLESETVEALADYIKAIIPAMAHPGWQDHCRIWLMGAAMNGDVSAQLVAGRCYCDGTSSFVKDLKIARDYIAQVLYATDINIQQQALAYAKRHPELDLSVHVQQVAAQLTAPTKLFAPLTPNSTAAHRLESTAASCGRSTL